jgi:hypothetical protein
MRSSWRWVGLAVVFAAIAIGVACGGGGGSEDQPQQVVGAPDAGPGPGTGNGGDAGPADAGPDGGTPDAGPPDAGPDAGPPDAGPDAGPPDAGPDAGPPDGGTLKNVVFPTTANWDFYGPQNGGPQDVLDVAMDEGGNLWVAGGKEGLFLMRADPSGKLSGTFEKFGIADGLHPYGWLNGETAQAMGVPNGTPSDPNPSLDATPVISLAGGPAGTVFVGYHGKSLPGVYDCEGEWKGDQWTPPAQWGDPAIYKSGDADRVTLTATGISVVHYDIFSGPGMVPNEIKGREKLCTIHRLVWDKEKNLIWFGGNHGFAVGQADAVNVPTCNGIRSCSQLLEHSHPAISGCAIDYDPATGYCPGSKSLWLTDSYFGIAVDPASHDMWMGGSIRTTKFRIATLGGDFFSAQSETEAPAPGGMSRRWDLWPDQVPEYDTTRNATNYVMPLQRSTQGATKPDWALDDGVSAIVALNDGTAWVGSFSHGLIHIDSSGNRLADATSSLASRFVSSLALDPSDASLWAGMAWGLGISRIGAANVNYQGETFGNTLVNAPVANVRAGIPGDGAARRMLVGFRANGGYTGAVAIFRGP